MTEDKIESMAIADEPCPDCGSGHHRSCQPNPEVSVPVQNQPLTPEQFRKLRGRYFTIRHHRAKPCNHKIDEINEPRHRNCESCYFMWFSAHGELVQVADRALQEQGKDFLIRMRGRHFYEMFVRYMSTLARLKKEQERDKETRIAREEIRTTDGDKTVGNTLPENSLDV